MVWGIQYSRDLATYSPINAERVVHLALLGQQVQTQVKSQCIKQGLLLSGFTHISTVILSLILLCLSLLRSTSFFSSPLNMYVFSWLCLDLFRNKLGMLQPSWWHSREEVVSVMAAVTKELGWVMETL